MNKKSYKGHKVTVQLDHILKEGECAVFSQEDGDIVDYIPEDTVSIVYYRADNREKWHQTKMSERFTIFPKAFDEVSQILTGPECLLLVKLTRYISYNTCYLTQDGTEDGLFCNLEWMANDLDYKYGNFKKLMNQLFNKGIIGIFKAANINGRNVEKIYVMNPFVCRKGTKIDVSAIGLFKNAWHPKHMPKMKLTDRPIKRSDHRLDNKKVIVVPRKKPENE